MPYFAGLTWTVLAKSAQHRMARLLALVRSRCATAPADEAALRRVLGAEAALLDAGPWALSIEYRYVGPSRARFIVPLDTPLPEGLGERRERQLAGWQERYDHQRDVPIFLTCYAAEIELAR